MSAAGSESLVDLVDDSSGSGTASRVIVILGAGQSVAVQAEPARETIAPEADEQDEEQQAEQATRTVTRTADRTEDGEGSDGIRTTTRLVTQTGTDITGVVPTAEATRSVVQASSAGAAAEQAASTEESAQSVSEPLASSTSIASVALAPSSVGTSLTRSSDSAVADASAPASSPEIIQVVTSTPNTEGSKQVSTFNPLAPSSTALGTAAPSGVSNASADMDMLNMSPMSMSTATNNQAAAQSDSAPTSGADNLFMPGNRLFPLGVTIIVLGGLFLLVSLAIVLIRVFGWNSKRRFRKAISSFINIDPSRGATDSPATMFDQGYEKPTVNIASTDPFRDRDSGASFGGAGRRAPEVMQYGAAGPFQPRNASYIAGDDAAYGGAYFAAARAAEPSSYVVGAPDRPSRARRPPPDGVGYDIDQRPLQNPFDVSPGTTLASRTLDVPVDVSEMGSPVPSFGTGILASTAEGHAANRPSLYATGRPEQPAVGRSLTSSSQSPTSSSGKRPAYHPARQTSQGEVLVIGPSSGHANPFADGSTGYVPATRDVARGSNGSLGSSMYTASSGEYGDIDWVTPGVVSDNIAARGPASGSRKLGKPAVWGSNRV